MYQLTSNNNEIPESFGVFNPQQVQQVFPASTVNSTDIGQYGEYAELRNALTASHPSQQDQNNATEPYNVATTFQQNPPIEESGITRSLIENSVLKDWIARHPVLKCILSSYETQKFLTKAQRNLLSRELIKRELGDKDSIEYLSHERFSQLAKEICNTFPNEKEAMFYVPYVKRTATSKGLVPKGALYTTVKNMKAQYTSMNKSRKGPIEDVTEVTVVDNSDTVDPSALFIINKIEPWNEVLLLWKKTKQWRTSLNIGIKEYFGKFLCLQEANGWTLLQQDFDQDYPENANKMQELWPLLRQKLIPLLVLKVKDSCYSSYKVNLSNELNDDVINATVLSLLPLLFHKPGPMVADLPLQDEAASQPKKRKKVQKWNPTRQESINGFFCRVETTNNFMEEVENMRRSAANNRIGFQPRPVVIGAIDKILSSYVVTNDMIYKVDTPLQALDVTYKLIFSLNSKYPPESKPAWLFLQKAVYKMSTAHDGSLPLSVLEVLTLVGATD